MARVLYRKRGLSCSNSFLNLSDINTFSKTIVIQLQRRCIRSKTASCDEQPSLVLCKFLKII